ncbi:MAG: NHL repeat-containing protein [Actinomycetes bacterium]
MTVSRNLSNFAGNSQPGFSGDGAGAELASLSEPAGIAIDQFGSLVIADSLNHRLRRVSVDGVIITIAGTGTIGFSGDGGPARFAALAYPTGVAIDALGCIFIADTANNRVRMIDLDGTISTVAGDGASGLAGDGDLAVSARLAQPTGVALDGPGNLYIADSKNHRIRKVSKHNGSISTYAGTTFGRSGDGGPATRCQLFNPQGIAVDWSGNLFIADTNNHQVRRVLARRGTISTVAGSGVAGFSGDGGYARSAELHCPFSVAIDAPGNLYIADTDNQRVRRVLAMGERISTVAGNRQPGSSSIGLAPLGGALSNPYGVAIDESGHLYISDTQNHRVTRQTSLVPSSTRRDISPLYSRPRAEWPTQDWPE